MRVVLDTNILVSALLIQVGHPAAVYRAWQEGYFTLLTCAEQLEELRTTLRKPAIAERIKPYKAGRLVNEIKGLAEEVGALPRVRKVGDRLLLFPAVIVFAEPTPGGRRCHGRRLAPPCDSIWKVVACPRLFRLFPSRLSLLM